MKVDVGSRFGPYEIAAEIVPWMGVVYRARDTRLGRDVAIKVSNDPIQRAFRARSARRRRPESSQHRHASRRRP